MYKNIMNNYDSKNINFFWGHNHHINSQMYHDFNLEYIKNKSHKYYCGYYLKKKLKDDYCIILSQAYSGENRFNGYCDSTNCLNRTWNLNYFYKKFRYPNLKKYVNNDKKYQLLEEFNEPQITFSNSYFKGNKFGSMTLDNIGKTWNYILFWNSVTKLKPIINYQT